MLKKKIIFLLGPTGIGKSAVAINLAKKINAEILSCDSMQVYRKMDILTSKITPRQKKQVKHHLLGIIDPQQEYNVAKYRKAALLICDKLLGRGKIPLFVGGSGLYYSIMVDGLFAAVPQDRLIRAKLEKQLKLKGSKYLYRRLARVDSAAAAKIHPNDARRIIRALEVYFKTGSCISKLQKKRVGLGSGYEVRVFGLNSKRQFLYDAIDRRVEKMFDLGVINEVTRLLKVKLSRTAECAIGIPELKGYLAKKYSLAESKRLMQRNSRHYAKRQLTWFRKDKRIKWIDVGQAKNPAEIADKIIKYIPSLTACTLRKLGINSPPLIRFAGAKRIKTAAAHLWKKLS
ncbi:MAG: tRNA (adenosine(37)-N6)-dimethylallyltransferase MiaA [Candidatus Omnitrophica bacterium CG11_big_fil_rev_8_21_14_0_20_43_6]|nr:MAG: tRNA (adenosine(37)-N6)-dimethylallyltransferase MiaA [Candidatus Omnitrophica bacterium CG11_big_fil_rev_8_21_14_0_20_43_6]